MNCVYHINKPITAICIAPHKCSSQRKLCINCIYEHGVDAKQSVPIEIFQDKAQKKLQEEMLDVMSKLTKQRIEFEKMLSHIQAMLTKIWEESQSIQKIYNWIEIENQSYIKILQQNPAESSYTDLEQLVSIVEGTTLNDWNDEMNYYMMTLEKSKNEWKNEIYSFLLKFNQIIEEIKMIQPVYEPMENLADVLNYLKNIDESIFNEIILKLKEENISNPLFFLSTQNLYQMKSINCLRKQHVGVNQTKMILNILKNIQKHEFNQKDYSTNDYEQFKENLIKKINGEKKIIEFLKFLVHLTSIDNQFIQCGSNSLNLLVQMKTDLTNQNLEDKSIYLWDIKTGQQKAKLDGHTCIVLSVCYSPDGSTLASGGDDNSIHLWDTERGYSKAKLNGHINYVRSVCFSPDGTTLASVGADYVICLWDVTTKKKKVRLNNYRVQIWSVCFSPDGTSLASGNNDNSICLWDTKTGQQKAKLKSDQVRSICFSPDGTLLASGSRNSIFLWDVKTRQQSAKLDGHTSNVWSVCFSPNGSTLASGSYDKSIRLWDVKTPQQQAQLDDHSNKVQWDIKTGAQIVPIDKNYKGISAQFQTPFFKDNSFSGRIHSHIPILLISQEAIFQAQGTLILKGSIENRSGIDLKTLFKQKGSIFLEKKLDELLQKK